MKNLKWMMIVLASLSTLSCTRAFATVDTDLPREIKTCNGSSKSFTFSFSLTGSDTSQLVVELVEADGTGLPVALTEGVNYTVSGVNYSYESGGTVLTTVAYSSLYKLILRRVQTHDQDYDMGANELDPVALNAAFDKLVRWLQELTDSLDRTIHAPTGEPTATNLVLPARTDRAGKLMGFDAAGTSIRMYDVNSTGGGTGTGLPDANDGANMSLAYYYPYRGWSTFEIQDWTRTFLYSGLNTARYTLDVDQAGTAASVLASHLAAYDHNDIGAVATQTISLQVCLDGGGEVLPAGMDVDLQVPVDLTLNYIAMVSDVLGSCEVDLYNYVAGGDTPDANDTITGGVPPAMVGGTTYDDAVLSGWTVGLTAKTWLRFHVVSCTDVTRITVSLIGTKD